MANQLEEAKSAFVKCAEAKLNSEHPRCWPAGVRAAAWGRSPYFAAKHYETAAGCAIRQAEQASAHLRLCRAGAQEPEPARKVLLIDEGTALMLEAANQFKSSGHLDQTVGCYSKAARCRHSW